MEEHILQVLLVDDDEDDYLITRELLDEIEGRKYEVDWIAHYDEAIELMKAKSYDIYLFDYSLRGHTGLDLLREITKEGIRVPVILMTGQGDHDIDIEAMNQGAMDYLVKGEVDSNLLERSIRYAVARHRTEMEQEGLIKELEEALTKIKTLNGLLPICANCKMVRDDSGYWSQIEQYVANHSNAEFSHSVCPQCAKTLYPGYTYVEDKPM